MRFVVMAALLTGGCDAAFGITSVASDASCANPGADEDGDCRVDVSDNCPGVANADQLDGDRDGVGDVCDPAPMTPGDRLFAFYSFEQPYAMWALPPAWAIANGTLVAATEPSGYPTAVLSGAPAYNLAVELDVVITAASGAATDEVTLLANADAGSWQCTLTAGTLGAGPCSSAACANQTVPYPPGRDPFDHIGTTLHFRYTLTRTVLTCALYDPLGLVATASEPLQQGAEPFVPGNVGVEVNGVSARVPYVAIYDLAREVPPPL